MLREHVLLFRFLFNNSFHFLLQTFLALALPLLQLDGRGLSGRHRLLDLGLLVPPPELGVTLLGEDLLNSMAIFEHVVGEEEGTVAADFAEAIEVELPDETGEVAVAEEFGQDELFELAFMLDLDAGLLSSPADDVGVEPRNCLPLAVPSFFFFLVLVRGPHSLLALRCLLLEQCNSLSRGRELKLKLVV